MSDIVTERMGLITAPSESARKTFSFSDAPQLSASTFDPSGFVWDEVDTVPPDFIEDGVFTSFSQRYVGYLPAKRDRHEVAIYVAGLRPDRVAPAASTAVQLAAKWGRLSFGVVAHDLEFGEVLGGDESSGVMMVNRISVWRRGHQALILRQTFEAEHFSAHAETIATLVGSLNFAEELSSDPVIQNAHRSTLATNGFDFSFLMPENWSRLVSGPTGAPLISEVWYDAADKNGNGAVMVAMGPPVETISHGQRPAPVPEQQMADLAGTIATVFMQNILPDAQFQLSPQNMTSFADLDEITAFNRMYFIDVALNGAASGVITVEIVMPADGTTLVNASLSPAPLDPYLLGTQHHVSLATGFVHTAIVAYAIDAAHRQGWTQ